MTDWPELALEAHKRTGKNSDFSEILNRLKVNALNLKPLFFKIDKIFDETIRTPNALDRQGDHLEPDNIIKLQFWIQFFESLAYATQKHSPRNEQDISKDKTSYAKTLQTAIEQADNLAENLELLCEYSNRGFNCDSDLYDPLQWIITAVQIENKDFNNPVFAELENLQRYDNGRYWPSHINVIDSLSCALKNLQAACDEQIKTKTPAILNDLKDANWCRHTKYSWHLPQHFMGRLSDSDLSLLISTALGLALHLNKSSIRRAREAIGYTKT
jgi:hypothetical protein